MELGACGYVVGSKGKLTNATSPFLPRILIVRPVDGDGTDLSEGAFACEVASDGVGRPADTVRFEWLPGLRSNRIVCAAGSAGALSVAPGKSGTTGLYGLLRNAGTKNGLGVFTSDGVGECLLRAHS